MAQNEADRDLPTFHKRWLGQEEEGWKNSSRGRSFCLQTLNEHLMCERHYTSWALKEMWGCSVVHTYCALTHLLLTAVLY